MEVNGDQPTINLLRDVGLADHDRHPPNAYNKQIFLLVGRLLALQKRTR